MLPTRIGAGFLLVILGTTTALAAAFRPPAELAFHVCGLGLALGLVRRPLKSVFPRLPWAAALLFVAVLAGKDLAPASPLSGTAERRAALAVSELTWPATARNPALGPAAAHIGAILLGLALIALLAHCLTGSDRQRLGALETVAWLLAAFGGAVMLGTTPERAYGPGNCIGNMASKNGAGALVAIGLLLHATLARGAWLQQGLTGAIAHLAAAAALLLPLLRLGSWTALLTLTAGGATYLWLIARRRRSPWREALLAAAAATAATLLVATLDPGLAGRMAGFARDGRWLIWQDSLALTEAYPIFGVGLGAFESVYPLHGTLPLEPNDRLVHPDSSWVKLLTEWGMLPLGLALAAGGCAAWRHTRSALRTGPRGAPDPGIIAIATIAAWLASGLTDVTLHRPESFLMGVVLVGIAAGRAAPFPSAVGTGYPGLALAWGVLGLGGVTAAWAGHAERQALRWSLLDPARLWRAAAPGGQARAPDSLQLSRLHAAVRLQHRAVSYPYAAARALHPRAPVAALPFWELAVTRAGPRSTEYLDRAIKEFPGTPAGYWAEVARATDPDLLLSIPGLPADETTRAIKHWIERSRPQPVPSIAAYPLLSAVARTGRADLLARALDRLQVDDARFWAAAGRILHEQGLDGPAWSAVARALPPATPPARPPPPPALGPDTLLRLNRYPELRDTLLGMTGSDRSSRRALLEKICAAPDAPAWFHFEAARELALAGELAAATQRALAGLSLKPRS